ncbi:MAG: hypothetical protein SGBAC_010561 [Bacillariaceae sp.]
MQAVAPSDILVKPGDCVSLCGNGPIALEGNKKYRKVSEVKLIELLFGEEGMNAQQQSVLDAFNLVTEADDFLKQKNYAKAVELYGKGIEMGLEPAMSTVETTTTTTITDDDGSSSLSSSSSSSPNNAALQWLVNAREQEATAKLNLGDVDGAVVSAQSACEISSNSSLGALEILQESYAKLGNNPKGELETLQLYFSLPEPTKMTTMQSNKRRNLGFRLQKLEREVK